MKQIDSIRTVQSAILERTRTRRYCVGSRGQAAVEFALVATVAMIVLFVAVQLALIGEDALALGQMNYQGARWAAVNTCASAQQIADYMGAVGSPTITKGCLKNVTITLIDSNNLGGTTATPSNCAMPTPPTTCANPRTFGSSVQITLSFNAQDSIFLGNGKKWMGLIDIPTVLTSTETAMAE